MQENKKNTKGLMNFHKAQVTLRKEKWHKLCMKYDGRQRTVTENDKNINEKYNGEAKSGAKTREVKASGETTSNTIPALTIPARWVSQGNAIMRLHNMFYSPIHILRETHFHFSQYLNDVWSVDEPAICCGTCSWEHWNVVRLAINRLSKFKTWNIWNGPI